MTEDFIRWIQQDLRICTAIQSNSKSSFQTTFSFSRLFYSQTVPMNYILTDNEDEKQYEFHLEDEVARIEYIKAQGRIFLTHTEVPESLEGKGIGSALIKQVLDDIQGKGLILVPLCPFVAVYIRRHPEYMVLVENK